MNSLLTLDVIYQIYRPKDNKTILLVRLLLILTLLDLFESFQCMWSRAQRWEPAELMYCLVLLILCQQSLCAVPACWYSISRAYLFSQPADTPVSRAYVLSQPADTPVSRAYVLSQPADTPVSRAYLFSEPADTPVRGARVSSWSSWLYVSRAFLYSGGNSHFACCTLLALCILRLWLYVLSQCWQASVEFWA